MKKRGLSFLAIAACLVAGASQAQFTAAPQPNAAPPPFDPGKPFTAAPQTSAAPPPQAQSRTYPALDAAAQAWGTCLFEAADALYAQPEPSKTIASVVLGICSPEDQVWTAEYQVAFPNIEISIAHRVQTEVFEQAALARIIVNRAASAKVRGSAETSHAPTYRPM